MQQDFTKKISIIINRDLELWQVLNTAAHMSAFIGNKMTVPFDTGTYFSSKDAVNFPRNSQFPIVILSAKSGQIRNLYKKIEASGLLYIVFIKEMIETNIDQEIIELLKDKNSTDIDYLGIGIFGEKEHVDRFTKKFSLWK